MIMKITLPYNPSEYSQANPKKVPAFSGLPGSKMPKAIGAEVGTKF